MIWFRAYSLVAEVFDYNGQLRSSSFLSTKKQRWIPITISSDMNDKLCNRFSKKKQLLLTSQQKQKRKGEKKNTEYVSPSSSFSFTCCFSLHKYRCFWSHFTIRWRYMLATEWERICLYYYYYYVRSGHNEALLPKIVHKWFIY